MNKSEHPLISIVMNCYNGEKYLRDAIKSIINQTYQNWELIFWDNQSTDKSANIVKSFKDDRILYFYADKHTDLGEARKEAISQAHGSWLGFLDTDDLYLPDKLSHQVKEINRSHERVSLIYSRCEYFQEQNKKSNRLVRYSKIFPKSKNLPNKNLFLSLLKGNLIPSPSVLYYKNSLDEIKNLDDFKYSPDYFMSIYIASKYNCLGLNKVLCKYRLHENNLSNSKKEDGYLESIRISNFFILKYNLKYYLKKYNRIRYIAFLTKNFQIKEIYSQIKLIGILHFITGAIELMVTR